MQKYITNIFLIIAVVLFTNTGLCQTVIKIDTTGWTQDEKNMTKAIVYKIVSDAGDNEVPDIQQEKQDELIISFNNIKESTEQLVTAENIKNVYDQEKLTQEQIKLEEELFTLNTIESIRTKLINNEGLTDEEIDFLFDHLGFSD